MDKKRLMELAGVPQENIKRVLTEAQSINTRVYMGGDEYVVSASLEDIFRHLGEDEEAFIRMLDGDGEWEASTTRERADTDLNSFIKAVQTATASAQMDHWDPSGL